MRVPVLCVLSFAIGCSDYTVSAMSPDVEGTDSGTQYDTAPPITPFEAEPEEDPEEDCVESSTAFDIEEISTLQDAFGLARVRDGLTLDLDPSAIEGDRTWRPVSVRVLVMYPVWYFDFYDDSNELTVEFYPQADPMGALPLSKTIRIRKADLEWEELLLPVDADWSGDDREQMAAWLDFDLSDVVPEDGYTTTDYFVSLAWDAIGYPNVGYSNFELNCLQNWTDYGNGAFVQNTGQDCSWPMLKIEIETYSPGDCDE